MNATFLLYQIIATIITILLLHITINLFNKYLFPLLVDKKTKDLEINPKWIVPKLKENYYGFHDIDIIIVDSPLGELPRFRLSKDKKKLQLLLPEDTSTNDTEMVAQIALAGKLNLLYGEWYPDKPAYWLSILLYLLDGGDIRIDATKWENKQSDRQETN